MSLLALIIEPPKVPTASKIAATCSAMVCMGACHLLARQEESARVGNRSNDNTSMTPRREKVPSNVERSLEDVFIQSLVLASSCKKCSEPKRKRPMPIMSMRSIREERERYKTSFLSRRHFSSRPAVKQTAALAAVQDNNAVRNTSREQYKELANTYDSHSDLWEEPREKKTEHFPLAPRLILSPEQEDRPPYSLRHVLQPEDDNHADQIRRLKKMLANGAGHHLRKIWRVYQSLRSPRPRYLPDTMIRKLFRHLGWVEVRTFESSQRYFAFLDECLAEKIPIKVEEWNTATSFAGRWIRRVSTNEVKAAVETWMRMEHAGVRADSVTFNILIDVAVRAQRFALADTIYHELKARNLPLNRYFRTSMIYYAGMRRDGDGVRRAFRELVNAGEIVDTAVMNCVILSLIRAGEAASAEIVFAKMRDLHATKFGTPAPRSWQERRRLGAALVASAHKLRTERERHQSTFFGSVFYSDRKREDAQRAAPIAPDSRTYQILIRWHAYVSGDLDKIRVLLAGMRESGFRVHGVVYSYIFQGFCNHGGHAYTAWNRESLEKFWDVFQNEARAGKVSQSVLPAQPDHSDSVEQDHESGSDNGKDEDEDFGVPEVAEHDRPPYFAPPVAIRALRAFYKCAGPKKMLAVWQEILEQWRDIDPVQKECVQDAVAEMLREDSVYLS